VKEKLETLKTAVEQELEKLETQVNQSVTALQKIAATEAMNYMAMAGIRRRCLTVLRA
jgi:hypothetical protein